MPPIIIKMELVLEQLREVCVENAQHRLQSYISEETSKQLQTQLDLADISSKMNRRIRRALLDRLHFLRTELDNKTQKLEALLLASKPLAPEDPACSPPLYCVACYGRVAEWGIYHKSSVHLCLCHDCAARSPDVCPTCREPGKLVRVHHAGISPYCEHDLV